MDRGMKAIPLSLFVAMQMVGCQNPDSPSRENTTQLHSEAWTPSNPIVIFKPENFDFNNTSHQIIEYEIRRAIHRESKRVVDPGKLKKEDFEQVRELGSLGYNEGIDLAPLTGLKSLEYLRMDACKIGNIELLASLSSLKRLNLNQNEISDLRPLTRLKKLESVFLDENPIEDLSPLENLPNLKFVQLNFCNKLKRTEINRFQKVRPNIRILAWEDDSALWR